VAASAAIVRASEIHRINPIVLLIKAQTVQGLLGEGYYPSSSDRVEYAFGCGCAGRGSCDLALAGLDKQVDCLARALRKSFDELGGKDGKTAGGWAVGVERQTLDGVKVTPGNKATAALYQYAPLVERSQGGNWLFWNLWGKYTEALTYFGPTGGRPNGSWVGDTCTKDADCTFPGGQCQSAYVGGFCTAPCNPNPCPSSGSRVETFCGSFGGVGYCTPICDPNVPASCRDGYECRGVKQSGGSLARNVCVPR
jgi:hypothetical protein